MTLESQKPFDVCLTECLLFILFSKNIGQTRNHNPNGNVDESSTGYLP